MNGDDQERYARNVALLICLLIFVAIIVVDVHNALA